MSVELLVSITIALVILLLALFIIFVYVWRKFSFRNYTNFRSLTKTIEDKFDELTKKKKKLKPIKRKKKKANLPTPVKEEEPRVERLLVRVNQIPQKMDDTAIYYRIVGQAFQLVSMKPFDWAGVVVNSIWMNVMEEDAKPTKIIREILSEVYDVRFKDGRRNG